MNGYQVDQAPFYTSPDDSVWAYHGLATERGGHPVTILCYQLSRTTYSDRLPDLLDAVLNLGLEQAKTEGNCPILEMQVDLSEAPERYTLFHIVDVQEEGRKEETDLQKYMHKAAAQLTAVRDAPREGASELYQTDSKPFYMSQNGVVSLFKGDSNGLPIIAKRHKFVKLREKTRLPRELASAMNAGLAQSRVEHLHTCIILQMHLDVSEAPTRYRLDHILEALDSDVEKEIEKRKEEQRPMSEGELCNFLVQTSEALAFAHSKVRGM